MLKEKDILLGIGHTKPFLLVEKTFNRDVLTTTLYVLATALYVLATTLTNIAQKREQPAPRIHFGLGNVCFRHVSHFSHYGNKAAKPLFYHFFIRQQKQRMGKQTFCATQRRIYQNFSH